MPTEEDLKKQPGKIESFTGCLVTFDGELTEEEFKQLATVIASLKGVAIVEPPPGHGEHDRQTIERACWLKLGTFMAKLSTEIYQKGIPEPPPGGAPPPANADGTPTLQ